MPQWSPAENIPAGGYPWVAAGQQAQPRSPEAILESAAEGDLAAVVQDILNVAGREEETVIIRPSAHEPTAAAMETSGAKVIRYNPIFLARLSRLAQTDWATVFVIAHELAHHLLGHVAERPPRSRDEVVQLEADEIAGVVLGSLGAPLSDARRVVTAVGRLLRVGFSATGAKLAAVERGWRRAKRGIESFISGRV